MTNVFNIFRREVSSQLGGPVFYMTVAVTVAVTGYFFFADLFLGGHASLRPMFETCAFLMVFVAPAVTMRSIAEERRHGTLELVLTMPVQPTALLLGKLAGAVFLLMCAVLATVPYAFVVMKLGAADLGAIVSGFLGLLLLVFLFAAIGLLCSTITSTQAAAFLAAWFVCFVLFMVTRIVSLVPASIAATLQKIGAGYYLGELFKGVIDLRAVLYFLSFGIAATLVAEHLLATARKVRSLSYGVVVLASAIVINVIVARVVIKWDLTEEQLFTLSPATEEVLEGLEDVVSIRVYFTPDLPPPYHTIEGTVRDMLDELRDAGDGNIVCTFIDPATESGAEAHLREVGIPGIPLDRNVGDKVESVTHYLGIELVRGTRSEVLPVVIRPGELEYDLTSAIARLVRTRIPKIGVLTGLNLDTPPPPLQGAFDALKKRYDVRLTTSTISKDLDGLIVLGPYSQLDLSTVRNIDSHVQSGKGVFFLLNAVNADMERFVAENAATGLDGLLSNYGLRVRQDLLEDGNSEKVGVYQTVNGMRTLRRSPYHYIIRVKDIDQAHPITRGLGQMLVVFASTLEITAQQQEVTVLMRTSERTWRNEGTYRIHPVNDHKHGELIGPQVIAAAASGMFTSPFGVPSQPSRVVVMTDADFVQNRYLSATAKAFLLNGADWVTGEGDMSAIRSRGKKDRSLMELSSAQKSGIRYGTIGGIAIVVMLFGLARWALVRRRRQNASF